MAGKESRTPYRMPLLMVFTAPAPGDMEMSTDARKKPNQIWGSMGLFYPAGKLSSAISRISPTQAFPLLPYGEGMKELQTKYIPDDIANL
jgi:hypothetical protein